MGYKKAEIKGMFPLGSGSGDLADSLTYYVAGSPGTGIVDASGTHKFTMVESGTIRFVTVNTYSTTAAGTAENISVYIRKNNTTNYLVATIGIAEKLRVFTNANMNVPLIAGDYFEVIIVCPAWATNPTATRIGGIVTYS